MAWRTTYGDANKREVSRDILVSVFFVPGLDAMIKIDVLLEVEYVGMTYATAILCQDEFNDPPDAVANLRRAGPSGNFNVNLVTITDGTWTAV